MGSAQLKRAGAALTGLAALGLAGCGSFEQLRNPERRAPDTESSTPTEVTGPDGLTLRTSPTVSTDAEPLEPVGGDG